MFALTCTIDQHRQQHRRQHADHDRRAFPRAPRRQSLAKVQRRRIVVRRCAAHGAARWQNGSRVAAVVALQCVLGGRRARRATFVFNRWSFVDIYVRRRRRGQKLISEFSNDLRTYCVCFVCSNTPWRGVIIEFAYTVRRDSTKGWTAIIYVFVRGWCRCVWKRR